MCIRDRTVTIYAVLGVPAHTTTLVYPHGKESCVKLRTCHNTHHVPVHNKAVNPPTGKKHVSRCVRITTHRKEACVKMRAYHNTHYVPVHNIAIDEKPAYGGDTSQIVTDGVPTHTTTFVHAGAWIVTLSLLCGVPAHATTVVHAGA